MQPRDPTFIGLPEVIQHLAFESAADCAVGTTSLAINFNVAVLGAGRPPTINSKAWGPTAFWARPTTWP